ncbi:MAG: PilN domain-containing protein [Gammaproteobacteria bacterium]|nr:PilN domain-containing protein [Gammaproteobacteria bacterium]
MARINLLPWREAERKRRQQEFGMMVMFGVMITLFLLVGAHMQIESQINAQAQRNSYLQREIDEVERQITEIRDLDKTKANLLARMNIIQELQSSRPQIVHLFDEVVSTLPDGVFLDLISQSGTQVEMVGQAQSNARVSSFMRNIEESLWLGNPRLDFIESKESTGTGLSHFKLTASQISQIAEVKK